MKTFTIEDIRSWEPCYNPNIYLKEGWSGTAIDLLKIEEIPFQDRLWGVLRTELVSEKLMRLFAVWCFRDTLNWVKNPDPASVNAANVAERFANGEATEQELSASASAARSARSAADSAAWSASAARSAASAARSARSAADSAAWSASASAARSAASAARSAAKERQKAKLIEMINQEEKNKNGLDI